MRSLYVWLVNLHPRPFRDRFGEEMLETFDEAAAHTSARPLIADALESLARQWLLRSRPPRAAAHVAAVQATPEAPLFQTLNEGLPGRSALLNGAILSLAVLSLVVFSIGRNERFPRFLIGSQYPRPNVLPVDRNSIAAPDPTTEVKVTRPSADPIGEYARQYFQAIRVLAVLDQDGDLTLSPSEIAVAPIVLPRLDVDHDGRLDAIECGLELGSGTMDERATRLAAVAFILGNPALAALDRNRSATISAVEVRQAAESLRGLDLSGDGTLSTSELLPAVGVP